jgi:hypothetical protein
MQWVMAATLICSSTVFTGCSKSDDIQEPVVNPEQPDDNGANSGSDEVEPAQSSTLALVTASHLGWLVGSDGKAYDPIKGYMPIGVTALAKICYVGSDNGEAAPYNHGLALALSDANGGNTCKWKTSNTDAGHTKQNNENFTSESGLQYNDATHNSDTYPAFKAAMANNGTAAPTGCSAWFLPTGYQWNQMITGSTNYSTLRTNANLQSDFYWSSTEYASLYAWSYYFRYGGWGRDSEDYGLYVRAALAF